PQQTPYPLLAPRRRFLGAPHVFELRALPAQARVLSALAGVEQLAMRLGDLRRARFALRGPGLGGVEIVAAQEQRLRSAARFPARRQFAEPRVLADPVEIDPQRLGQLRERTGDATAGVEAHELQAAQLLGYISVRYRLVDHRQEAFRERECALHLPHAALGLHRPGRDNEHD